MKRFLAVLLGALLVLLPVTPISAQQFQLPSNASPLSHVGGRVYASAFFTWQGIAFSGFAGTGTQTLFVQGGGAQQLNDSLTIYPFATNAPITVDYGQANAETVTPTTVAGCTSFVATEPPPCAITATFVNSHGKGAIIRSGTAGLQEAINFLNVQVGTVPSAQSIPANNMGVVTIDGVWSKLGGTTANITGATLTGTNGVYNVFVEDLRGLTASYWSLKPGITNLATPAALVVATYTTSTTGGSIATALAIRGTVTYVDVFGGESAMSVDTGGGAVVTTGAGATNSLTIVAPVASPGAVGYRVYLSAGAGATLTETFSPPGTANSCLQAIASPIPACSMATNAVVSTLPATTAEGPPGLAGATGATLATGHTTSLVTASGIPPLAGPFPTVAQVYPSAGTSTAAAAAIAEITLPFGFMNQVGRGIRVCYGGTTTPSAATVAGTWSIAVGPRGNSATAPINAVAYPMVASTLWAAAADNFNGCSDIFTVSTGASGTVEGHGIFTANQRTNTAPTASVGDNTSAASAAVDLTAQFRISLVVTQSAASWTLMQARYMSVQPIN